MYMYEQMSSVDKSRKTFLKVEKTRREVIHTGSPKDFTYIIPITKYIDDFLQKKSLKLPDQCALPEGQFQRKKEFHVTAFGFGTKKLVETKINEAKERGEDLLSQINDILSETDFSFSCNPETLKVVHNKEYDSKSVVSQNGKAAYESEYTIVMDIEMPGMKHFFDRMQELGISLGVPATHVTLYIKQNGEATGLGIAITAYERQLKGEVFPHIETREIALKDMAQELS